MFPSPCLPPNTTSSFTFNTQEKSKKKNAKVEHDGKFPLTSGGFRSHAIVEALVEAGADIEAIGKADGTALLLCLREGDQQSVRYLLSKGANAKVEDNDQQSPLHWAVMKNLSAMDGNVEQPRGPWIP